MTIKIKGVEITVDNELKFEDAMKRMDYDLTYYDDIVDFFDCIENEYIDAMYYLGLKFIMLCDRNRNPYIVEMFPDDYEIIKDGTLEA